MFKRSKYWFWLIFQYFKMESTEEYSNLNCTVSLVIYHNNSCSRLTRILLFVCDNYTRFVKCLIDVTFSIKKYSIQRYITCTSTFALAHCNVSLYGTNKATNLDIIIIISLWFRVSWWNVVNYDRLPLVTCKVSSCDQQPTNQFFTALL